MYINTSQNKHDDLLLHTVTAKLSVQRKSGSWINEEQMTSFYLPADAPEAYVLYRKIRAGALLRKAMWEGLFHFGGGIDTLDYLDGVKETEQALYDAEEKFKFKSKSLMLVDLEANPRIQVKLFTDEIILDSFLKKEYDLSIQQIQSGMVPQRHKGSMVQDQDWYTEQTHFTNTSMTPTELLKVENPTNGTIL